MKTLISFLTMIMLVVSCAVSAALITVNDEEAFTPNSVEEDTLQFVGELSRANSLFSFGVNLVPGQEYEVSIKAPVAFDLFTSASTGVNATGITLASPGFLRRLVAGETFSVTANGTTASTWWFTLSLGDITSPVYDLLESDFGGSLNITDTLVSTGDFKLFDPNNPPVNPGDPGNPGDPVAVSAPTTLFLMYIALAVIVFRATKPKDFTAMRNNA